MDEIPLDKYALHSCGMLDRREKGCSDSVQRL